MDRTNPQVAQFAAAALAAFADDEALAALANKGLVRRAGKDLEKGPPAVVAADAESVTLEMEGQRVRLVQPVARSTCTCSAGVCRHVLACITYLRESGAAADQVAPPRGSLDELLALDDDALQAWTGKPLLRRAAVALARGYQVDESAAPAVVMIRLPAQNATVRLMAGGLDAIVCSCHAPAACEHKAAAILAFRAYRSGRPVEVPRSMLEASAGAPRSRDQVRQAVQSLLAEMVALGLARVSRVTEQRLRTLATSAHGVDLPRLERLLKSLADEVSQTLARDAAASSQSLLTNAARAAMLCAALRTPSPLLVGEHRSLYMLVSGSIELVGLGARRWRSRSGYHGLTLYFWEPTGKCWTTVTDARPLGTPGFDPAKRIDEDGPWRGCASWRQAAAAKWRVTGAHRNAAGRITSRANTRGVASGRTLPDQDGPAVRDFSTLTELARRAFSPGLAGPSEHANLVLLCPTTWLEPSYDPVKQEVTRVVVDAAGAAVPLVLRHSPETDAALTTLQRADANSLRAVLGALHLGPAGLQVEPITLWMDTKPMHLTVDSAAMGKPATAAASIAATSAEDEEADEDDALEPAQTPRSSLGRRLAGVFDELLSIAEGGVDVLRDGGPLREGARDCRTLGLRTVSSSLDRLVEALERHRRSIEREVAEPAAELLRSAYLLRLAMDCALVTEGVGGGNGISMTQP